MLVFERDGRSVCKINLHGKELELVDEVEYLEVKFSKDGIGKTKFESRFMQGKKIGSSLKNLKRGCVGSLLEVHVPVLM